MIRSCQSIPCLIIPWPRASWINESSIYSHLNATQHSFEDKDIVILDKEHKWFQRGVKEAIYVRRETPHLIKEGASDITYQKYTTQQRRKSIKDSRQVTIHLRHGSLNRKKITRPEEASRMNCDIVATKNIKSRWPELYHKFVIQKSYLSFMEKFKYIYIRCLIIVVWFLITIMSWEYHYKLLKFLLLFLLW